MPGGRASSVPRLAAALVYFQQQVGVDLIEVEESRGLPGIVARHSQLPVVARLHGPRFLTGTAHGIELNDEFHARVNAEGEGIVHACGVSSPSKFVLRAVEEQYQTKLRNCAIIPNAVSPVSEASIWTSKTADPDHLLLVGRVDRLKGADIGLRAFLKVLEQRPKARLTVVGPDRGIRDDTGRTRSALEWLRDEITPSQLRSRISLRGQLSRDEVVHLRTEAAVIVVPSRFENFPGTVLEAMAQGCPLVASRAGGIPEIVEHERNGLLSAPADADDLAARILCLLNNHTFATKLGKNALRDSLIRYSPTVVAKQDLEFYQEVCSRASAGSCNGQARSDAQNP